MKAAGFGLDAATTSGQSVADTETSLSLLTQKHEGFNTCTHTEVLSTYLVSLY